jgi:O-antigen ligase
MPTGSGIGSFPSVYATVEKPADLLAGRYANHAHNDLLEMWLETGLVGPTLLILFLIWLTRKGIAVFAKPNSDLPPVDRALVRASILIILLLLAHSLVDYPLRTSAMTALFAFACGLLIDPPVTSPRRARVHRQPSVSVV